MNDNALLQQLKNVIKPLQEGQERLISRLNKLEDGQKRLEESQTRLENGQTHITTAIEALAAGQEDLRKELARKADKADIQDLKADLMKRIKGHGRRISTLEDELDIPHPQKN